MISLNLFSALDAPSQLMKLGSKYLLRNSFVRGLLLSGNQYQQKWDLLPKLKFTT